MVFEQVKQAVAAQMNLDPAKITLESSLVDDLKADSLDIVELIMDLEQKYDLRIPDEALGELKTIGDIVSYIEGQKA